MKIRARITSLFSALQSPPIVGGLEVSDAALRFVFWDGKTWKKGAVKLVPGTMVRGEIEKRQEFLDALWTLRAQILGKHAKSSRRVGVVVSLSSIDAYTHVFALPELEGEKLENAIELNMQMASPASGSEMYSGWQLLGKGEKGQVGVLGAFLDKRIVNALKDSLDETGFLPIAVESRGISLSRVLRDAVGDFSRERPAVVVSVDASGLDVFVVRKGYLYFDYFHSWKELHGDIRTISKEAFRKVIARNVSRVVTYYHGHWEDRLEDIFVIATGMREEIVKMVQEYAGDRVSVRELIPRTSPPLPPEWLVAMGSGLRSAIPRRGDRELSLLGIDTQEEFRREQLLSFTQFWRVLMPSALAVLLLVFGGIGFFLWSVQSAVERQLASHVETPETREAAELRAEAARFNGIVALVKNLNDSEKKKSPALDALSEVMERHGVVATNISLPPNGAATLTGIAPEEENVLSFRDDLRTEDLFDGVDLPLTGIRTGVQGYAFSVSFRVIFSNTD